MRVDVKKSIQSLHAFGRHRYEGSIAALPSYFSSPVITSIIILSIIIFAALPSNAQEQDSNPADAKRIDLLFDQIMESLPDGMRMKVDSAASMKINRQDPAPEPLSIEHERKDPSPRIRMHGLPDELKVQVEREIENMDLRKEERKAQFRESGKAKR